MTRGILVAALAALAMASVLPGTAGAAFMGTNGKLAFGSARNGFPADNDLYTMAANGTAQTRISSLDRDELYPAWSPNGAKVVFERHAGLNSDIWIANADGSNATQLTANAGDDLRPSWSNTGARIVFASDRDATPGTYDLFVMNADGTNQVNITDTPTIDESYPAWSPAGGAIAFSRDGDLYSVSPSGGALAQLTATAVTEIEPDWSPSAGQIVYRTGITGDDEIWKMNANGTGQVNLTNNGATVEERPVWSPAGDKIAFSRNMFKDAEIWTMNGDGSGAARLASANSVMDVQPAWQPVPLAAGTVTVRLDSQPDDAQDFDYTADGLSPATFQLDDDANGTLSNERVFTGVTPGLGYSVTQAAVPGWDTIGSSCDDGSSPASIGVGAGENVTCTFTNRKRGRIVLVQDTVPNGPQDFSFTAGGGLGPTTFDLDDDSDPALSSTASFSDLAPGSGYSLAQGALPPGGWVLGSAACDDGSPLADIGVSAGEVVTCTFTNYQPGHIAVVADADPNDAQDFSYTAGGGLSPATFQLDDDADSARERMRLFDVRPGNGYSIAQSVPSGWLLGSASCDDGSPLSSIDVGPHETVICTFNYAKHGDITIVKDAQPDHAQDFSFTAGGGLSPTGFQLDDDSDATLSNTRTFASVPPGAGYSVSETAPSGWDESSAVCSDGSLASNVQVSPAESVTCTFTSGKQSSLTIVKDAQPDDGQDGGVEVGGGLAPASFDLDDDSDGTLSSSRTFADVDPGTYSASETSVPAGWSLASATCDDGSPVTAIDVGAGEDVTCTFTNEDDRGRIVVVKDAQPDDPQNFSFTAGGGLSPTSFTLDDDADGALSSTQTFEDVIPGSGYSVAETLPVGWLQISATCSDGSPVSNVDVAAGETVTCTFVNQRGYARPRGATPLKASLVTAFDECTSPNRVHGPGLDSPSCHPPSLSSPNLTVGTPDANGGGANMSGSVGFEAILGIPATPEDEADVGITASVTDVRLRSDNTDYAGELQGAIVLQITDRLNGTGLNEPATTSGVPFNFTIPCTTTLATTVGSTCALGTTADALLPGAVTEVKRSIWQMSDVRVSDGGPDGQASTPDNSPFLRQGVFVP